MSDNAGVGIDAAQIVEAFNRLFRAPYNTELVGGANEPDYQPASDSTPARIRFREDYVRSALHEVAHWSVAGEARRQLPDYGYWYSPDDRNLAQQRAFFTVEVKPQAVEWHFCVALQIPFSPSVDNLSIVIPEADLADFTTRLTRRYDEYQQAGLPPRAACFARALQVINQPNAA